MQHELIARSTRLRRTASFPPLVAEGQRLEPGETAFQLFGDRVMQDLIEISAPLAESGESAVGRVRRPETIRIEIGFWTVRQP
ncbi:MAG: hypothetical protein OXH76_07245 [Boseongicola sp.]|nr:hypothetical protein [Boseongicola sp.]